MKNNLEKKMEELQRYVNLLEDENTSLDEAISIYEKAVKLSNECSKILNDASGKIQELTKELETNIVDLKEFV